MNVSLGCHKHLGYAVYVQNLLEIWVLIFLKELITLLCFMQSMTFSPLRSTLPIKYSKRIRVNFALWERLFQYWAASGLHGKGPAGAALLRKH